MCNKNHDHMLYRFWDMTHGGSFWTIFYPFTCLKTQRKKIPGDIIILQMCTKNCDHMMYSSWDIAPNRPTDRWTDGRTDGLKKWHIQVSASPKNNKYRDQSWQKVSNMSSNILSDGSRKIIWSPCSRSCNLLEKSILLEVATLHVKHKTSILLESTFFFQNCLTRKSVERNWHLPL